MTKEAVVFGLAGTMFGLLTGWIIGSQQARPVQSAAPQTASAPSSQQQQQRTPPPIDLQRASALEQQAKAEPQNASVREQLGNLYFDGERFDIAITWYEAALKLNPKNIDVSTDLAVCYYYTNKADKALQQIDRSLEINPKHAKTLLNQGIIRAFGKQNLNGALESWQKVIQIAPDSPEAARAKQGIDGIKAAHADSGS
jgi:tetratricopeptide (TPR) repeat protein